MIDWLKRFFRHESKLQVHHGKDIYKLPRTSLFWILGSLTAVVLPHVLRVPFWLTLLCVLCLVSCVLIFQGRMSYPGSRIKTTIVFFTVIAIIAQYGRDIFSTDAIVGVLVVGLALKLLEMKQKRDVLLVIYLCYFTLVAEFIYSQSIPIAGYMVVCVLIITSALMSLTQTEALQRPKRTVKLAAVVLLQSVPLMAALFVLFPRIAPLWSVPIQNSTGTTGLSEDMSPGDIGNLTRSGEVAFRVQFASDMPPLRELYWRGITLDRFDGREWSRGPNTFAQYLGQARRQVHPWFQSIVYNGNPVEYNIIMEPTQKNWLFTLKVPVINDDRMIMRQDYQVNAIRPVSQRFSYDARSYLDHRVDLRLPREMRGRSLRLPDEGNEDSRDFAQALFAENGEDPRRYAAALLGHFREQPFFYTLSPSPLGNDPVDEFLFDTREGFCEHYASAFTFLMRAAGIPARVVTGYQGGEVNPLNSTLTVRQYDAHAWSEVWLQDEGWVRFDPTAHIAPDRIEYGSQFTFQEDENFLNDEVFSMLKYRGSSLLINDIVLYFEMMDYAWNRFVLNYDQGMQFALFSRLFQQVSKGKIVLTMLACLFAFVALVALLVLRKPTEQAVYPANALYLKFCRMLAKNGFARQPGEAPWHYCRRLCELQPQWAVDIRGITGVYVDVAFNHNPPEAEKEKLRDLRQSIRRFRLVN